MERRASDRQLAEKVEAMRVSTESRLQNIEQTLEVIHKEVQNQAERSRPGWRVWSVTMIVAVLALTLAVIERLPG